MRLRDPEKGSVLVPIALSALRLFTESDWRRLHQCKNDRCILFFYDTTKNGARRWCSPDCMNRARSIHQYQLAKKKASVESGVLPGKQVARGAGAAPLVSNEALSCVPPLHGAARGGFFRR